MFGTFFRLHGSMGFSNLEVRLNGQEPLNASVFDMPLPVDGPAVPDLDGVKGAAGNGFAAEPVNPTPENNVINGTDGDDVIEGTDGDDTINGGDGVDDINARDGADIVNGGDDRDFISGGDGDDQLFGDGGNDIISGDFGDDLIEGGEGDDQLSGGDDNDTIRGGNGADNISGGFGNDMLFGGDGDDSIRSDSGSDTIEGGAGDDYIDLRRDFDLGTVVADAGTGDDIVEVGGFFDSAFDPYSVTVDLGAGNDALDITNFPSTFVATLGDGVDRVRFFDFGDLVDRLGPGSVRITDFQLGDGGDIIEIRTLAQNFLSSGGDSVEWVDIGDDMALRFTNLTSGDVFDVVILEGLQFDDLPDANSDLGMAQEATNFRGTSGNDEFIGSDFNDTFTDGGGGNDVFIGNGGDDRFTIQRFGGLNNNVTVDGGEGDDSLFIDASVGGLFTIDMGAGDDFISIFRDPSFTTAITLGSGSDTVQYSSASGTVIATILDFEVGDGGDIFSLGFSQSNVNSNGDPFGSGELVLFQDGADTVLQRVSQFTDQTVTTLAIFQNTNADDFTSFNFGGIINPDAARPGVTFNGPGASETFTGTVGQDIINGLEGVDTLDGGDGADVIDGGDQGDTITGGFGNDIIRGGRGDDTINEAFGSNMIFGDDGDDTINITGYFGSSLSLDPDQIFGGRGNDTVNYFRSASEGLIVDLGDGFDRIVFHNQPRFNEITLGAGPDVVDINALGQGSYSTARPIIITDFKTGDGGDRLEWETWIRLQTDNVNTPGFNPFALRETVLTQVGNDVQLEFAFRNLGDGPQIIIFQNTQVADFTAFNFGFDPNAPLAPGDDFAGTSGDDNFTGTNVNDNLVGLGGRDRLTGRAGDDTIDGGPGNDTINGDQGDDTLSGGADADIINGGSGADIIHGDSGDDTINAGIGDGAEDFIDAGNGDDRITFSGSNDTYIGGAGNDELIIDGFGRGLAEAIDIDFTNFIEQGTFLLGGQLIDDIENVFYFGDASDFDDTIIFGSAYTFGQTLRGGGGNDALTGGSGGDDLDGEDGNDTLIGLGGDDNITDLSGNNRLEGGDGNDELLAGSGDDVLLGGDGDDRITPGAGIDTVDAGAGNDRVTITAIDAGETLDGGEGTDILQVGSFDTALNFNFADLASAGQSIVNFEEFDFVLSFLGDTLILGETFTAAIDVRADGGNDEITGGSGDDVIFGGEGSDILRGGSGNDELRGNGFGNGTDFDELHGDIGDDQLFGAGLLDGGEGNDFVSGEGELIGGDGNDSIVSFGTGDIIRGGAGEDNIFVRGAGATILLEAGLNRDRIDGFAAAQGATLIATAANTQLQWTDLRTGTTDQSEVIVEIAGVISDGGFANFEIIGTDLDDQINLAGGFGEVGVTIEGSAPIFGLGGNDDITGSLSSDTIFGGSGDDFLRSSAGSDILDGGLGDDTYVITSGTHTLVEAAGGGNDRVLSFVDIAIGNNIETLELRDNARVGTGSNTNNVILGTNLDNELFGLGGSDRLEGNSGNDLLDGGAGNDLLLGGQGNDILRGGNNSDILVGGEGDDTLDGGGADDFADYSGTFGPVHIDLSVETAQDTLSAGLDTLISIERVIGTDFDDTITGNGAVNVFIAGFGNDELDGGSNVDTAVFAGDLSLYTVVQFTDRSFGVVGPDGEDRLVNIEFAQFDDQTLRLRPGVGVSVNFQTSDPTVYASAVTALRDFGGNDLGGDGAWLRIGAADVNGDGDIDQILVNDAIGRFATIGADEDGLVYFEDHGWAGETRVAGIYIDPFVANGTVEQGSPFDSQARFRNDLEIENINRVLGANDYNNDGVWEVYLALTDGTAYLQALMHADGNIRFANYQSEQQVRNYLEANGFGEETFGDWFNNGSQAAPGGDGVVFEPTGVPILQQPIPTGDLAPDFTIATPLGTDDLIVEFYG